MRHFIPKLVLDVIFGVTYQKLIQFYRQTVYYGLKIVKKHDFIVEIEIYFYIWNNLLTLKS